MEHLTKQQIVLLTLLVSFVTSLATGIITVSLMDQGTFDITQVINHVEKTTAYIPAPTTATLAAVAAEPTLAEITSKVAKNVVRLKTRIGNEDTVLGMGIILSPVGLIVTDKSALSAPGTNDLGKNVIAELPNGVNVPLQVVQSQIIGDIAFAALLLPTGMTLTPVTSTATLSSIQLGENVYALSGEQTTVLETGIVKKVPENSEGKIETSIPRTALLLGSPLFNKKGQVIGFKTASSKDDDSFYPYSSLKSVAPQLSR